MSHVDSPVEQEWTIDFLWAIGRYILGCNQLEREQLIDPKLVERHDSYLWLIDKFYQWLIENDSRFRSRAVNISSNQAVLLAAILALWWISWRYDSYNMTHNGEYPDELTLNELELKILTEVNFRKRLEHFQQHCDPYRNWKLENLNRDFFPLRHHFQVGLSTSDQRQIQERLKLFFEMRDTDLNWAGHHWTALDSPELSSS